MENSYIYISSTGEEKDVRTLDYQYLVNALAKCSRTLYEAKDEKEFIKHSNNICVLQDELSKRNRKYYEEHFGSEELEDEKR